MPTEPHADVPYEKKGSLSIGIILTGLGLVFLLANFNIIPRMSRSWPLILIIVGAALVVGAIRDGRHSRPSDTTPPDPGDPPPKPGVPPGTESTTG
jgi:hypothetical protein